MIPLSERITLELRHRNPSEVTELILDTSKADKIEGLTDEFVNLKELSLINVGLKSLIGFPKLPNLEKLDLSDNMISGGLDCLTSCPKLTQLFLSNNRIVKIDLLQPLTKLQNLELLDLCHCAVSEIIDYRECVYDLLPQLVILDGCDKAETEESESEEYEDDDCDDCDDFNEDSSVSHTKGKIGSMLNYQEEVIERDYLTREEEYGEVDNNFLNVYNSNCFANVGYFVEEEETEEEEVEEDNYLPSKDGSKFRPNGIQSNHCLVRKRSSSSTDEYESTFKVFIRDSVTFVPSHD